MINTNEIVPVVNTDLISLYSVILKQASGNSGLAKLSGADGAYKVITNSAVLLCDAPVKSIDFDTTASSVSAGTVYFVAGYDFDGVSIDGTKVTPTGSADPDGVTLYSAVLATGTVTISKVGL